MARILRKKKFESIVIAIDIGNWMGHAVMAIDHDGTMHLLNSGVWDFSEVWFRSGGIRFMSMENNLKALFFSSFKLAERVFLIFERVDFRNASSGAARAYNGYASIVTKLCEQYEIPFSAYTTGTIRKEFTGHGHSSKEAVRDKVLSIWPEALRNCKKAKRKGEVVYRHWDDVTDAVATGWCGAMKLGLFDGKVAS